MKFLNVRHLAPLKKDDVRLWGKMTYMVPLYCPICQQSAISYMPKLLKMTFRMSNTDLLDLYTSEPNTSIRVGLVKKPSMQFTRSVVAYALQ